MSAQHAAVAASSLINVKEQGRFIGLRNLLRNENRLWWGTRRWLWQVLLWLFVVNGLLALATWGAPKGPNPTGLVSDPKGEAARALILTMGVLAPIGVLVLAQSAIVGEKRSGTAAWILSKPVSRSAVIVSKLLAYTIGILVTIVIVQGVIAYTQLHVMVPNPVSLGVFAGAIGLIALHLLFYLCLTLMLGTFADGYASVIGIAIAILLAQEIFADSIGSLVLFLPVALTKKLAQPMLQGESVGSVAIPVIAIAILSVVCIAIAIWRYEREDF